MPFDLNKFDSETPFLPPGFEIIGRLLVLLDDDADGSSEALAAVIRIDAGLTADVLRISNSAAHAAASRTETLLDAITRIGLREIYRIVTKIVTSPILSSVQQTASGRIDLWNHSLAAAEAAQFLARNTGDDPEIAFTAALLHDLGKVMLAGSIGKEYLALLDSCKKENQFFWEAEKQIFRIDHTDVGARLLQRWNFSPRIASAVRYHHNPASCHDSHRRLAALVNAGSDLPEDLRG
ncbi:MAG: putative signal transduction protein [Verrucomicrobiales bacterium]|nr:putative signal transduction protein [Verrucomicrobiales bacterium]